MTYQIQAGITVSITGEDGTWYQLTDHNRQPIKISYEVIEKTNRMADGTLRRYVINRKHKISASWQMVPSSTFHYLPDGVTKIYDTVDSSSTDANKGKGGIWMKSFYEANVFVPIKVKLITAGGTLPDASAIPSENTYFSSYQADINLNNTVYTMYITNFDYEVVKRNRFYDLVNINMEFTEV
jgi:hypothetical protein